MRHTPVVASVALAAIVAVVIAANGSTALADRSYVTSSSSVSATSQRAIYFASTAVERRSQSAMLLAVALPGDLATPEQTTPGFQNTVNNYAVGMNPEQECRHPAPGRQPACSQHMNFHFQANTDGTISAPFEMTNDSLGGFCGRVRIVARDRATPPGNVLLDVQSGKFCINGKGGNTDYHERVGHVDWTFQASPNVGRYGHDLYIVPVEYEDTGLDWAAVVQKAIAVIGTVVQVAGAIF
jgi:hypothetical protein